jgi:hypothetical protein
VLQVEHLPDKRSRIAHRNGLPAPVKTLGRGRQPSIEEVEGRARDAPVPAVDLAARRHSIAVAQGTFEAAVEDSVAVDSEVVVFEAEGSGVVDVRISGSSTISFSLAGFRTDWAFIGSRTMAVQNSMSV